MLCFVISFFVYFGVVFVLILMVFYDKFDKFVFLLEVFKVIGIFVVKYVIVVGGLCVLVGLLMSGIFVVLRIMYFMVSDGFFFKFFVRIYE